MNEDLLKRGPCDAEIAVIAHAAIVSCFNEYVEQIRQSADFLRVNVLSEMVGDSLLSVGFFRSADLGQIFI